MQSTSSALDTTPIADDDIHQSNKVLDLDLHHQERSISSTSTQSDVNEKINS